MSKAIFRHSEFWKLVEANPRELPAPGDIVFYVISSNFTTDTLVVRLGVVISASRHGTFVPLVLFNDSELSVCLHSRLHKFKN